MEMRRMQMAMLTWATLTAGRRNLKLRWKFVDGKVHLDLNEISWQFLQSCCLRSTTPLNLAVSFRLFPVTASSGNGSAFSVLEITSAMTIEQAAKVSSAPQSQPQNAFCASVLRFLLVNVFAVCAPDCADGCLASLTAGTCCQTHWISRDFDLTLLLSSSWQERKLTIPRGSAYYLLSKQENVR